MKILRRYLFSVVISVLVAFIYGCARKDPDAPGLHINSLDYRFVGNRGEMDGSGGRLVWEATVVGEIGTDMKWWFYEPPQTGGEELMNVTITYYTARWEIWSDEDLLIAGESNGKTVFAKDADGVWDGHGVVTEARAGFEPFVGKRIYETGPVKIGSNPPLSYTGQGMFVIY